MRVGIVTWYKNYNYGGTLQAYALKTIIESLGADVLFIDYDGNDTNIQSKFIRQLRNIMFWFLYPRRAASRKKMKAFINRELGQTKHYDKYAELKNATKEQFDVLVAGSDQIWNSIKGYNPYYFLEFSDEHIKIAYAPSMEKIDPQKNEFWNKAISSIGSFDYLSVREKCISDYLQSKQVENIKVVVDPTLLLDKCRWCDLLGIKNVVNSKNIPSKYICCYMISYNEKFVKTVEDFSKQKGLKVVYFASSKKFKKIKNWIYPQEGIGVEEFLNVISKAEYFFTDSYHGTLFGFQFEKQMVILKRFKEEDINNQNSRLDQIVRLYGLNSIYKDETNIEDVLDEFPIMNYVVSKETLKREREESIEWLRKAIDDSTICEKGKCE